MIPYSMMNGQLIIQNQVVGDFSIVDLSIFHFTFRFPVDETISCKKYRLNFFSREEGVFHSLDLEGVSIEIEEYPYYQEVRVEVDCKEYCIFVKKLMKEYKEYIELKQDGNYAKLMEEIVNYPSRLDECFPDSYQSFMKRQIETLSIQEDYGNKINEIGIALQNHQAYQDYLELGLKDYQKQYFEMYGLLNHPLSKKPISYLYIGNQFCFELMPSIEILKKLILKAKKDQVKMIFCLPPIQEDNIEQVKRLLEVLDEIEVVVNDYGTIYLVNQYPTLQVILGILLVKHKKDPRMKYKVGFNQDYYNQTSIHNSFYLDYLRQKHQIERISIEVSEAPLLPLDYMDVFFPFYNTNLATLCNIKAIEEKGNRGKIISNSNCPHYCKKQYCLYPSHLDMIGRMNGLFVFNRDSLESTKQLEKYLMKKSIRLIINI